MESLNSFAFYPTSSFLANSTINGLKQLLKNSGLQRILSFLPVLAAFIFTVWQIQGTMVSYLEHRVKITKKLEFNRVLEMPAITFCPASTYKRTVVGGSPTLLSSAIMSSRIASVGLDEGPKLCHDPTAKPIGISVGQVRGVQGFSSFTEYLKTILTHSSNSVLGCHFENKPVECADWFFNHFTDNGFCFTLNQAEKVLNDYPMKGDVNSMSFGSTTPNGVQFKMAGRRGGFQLFMTVNQSQYCIPAGQTTAEFIVGIHDRNSEPAMSTKRLIDLPPGFAVNVGIRISKIVRNTENWPTEKCYSHVDMKLYPSTKEYRNSDDWRRSCLSYKIWENCGCFQYYTPPLSLSTLGINFAEAVYCPFNMSTFMCSTHFEFNAIRNRLCGNADTPKPCYEIKYKTEVTSSKFPSSAQFNEFKRLSNMPASMSMEEFRRNFLLVNFFPLNMDTGLITYSPEFTWIDLMNQVGGALGISLGISIISIFEVFSWIVLQFLSLFQYCKRQPAVQMSHYSYSVY